MSIEHEKKIEHCFICEHRTKQYKVPCIGGIIHPSVDIVCSYFKLETPKITRK